MPSTGLPEEATLNPTAPSKQFRSKTAGYMLHTWRLTRLSIIFVKQASGPQYVGVCLLDPLDSGSKYGLNRLMTKVEDTMPGKKEAVGIAELVTEVL